MPVRITDCISPRLLGRVITEKLLASAPRDHSLNQGCKAIWSQYPDFPITTAVLVPGLLTLMLVCLQHGLALSFPALNCTKISLTGVNMTTRPSKSLISDISMDCRHLEFQTVAVTPADSEGLYTLAKNISRFESRTGSPARTQHIFSTRHQQRNDGLAYHSAKQSHIISDLHRRPEFYVPSSQIQLRKRPSSYHALRTKRPNVSHQFADRNIFYRQPGFYERKQETGIHQIASRIYPYKLGPNNVKATPDMHSPTYEVSGGKPPQGMSSNIHEISNEKQSPDKIPPSGSMTHDYVDTDAYHDIGTYKPHDYPYDHSYDSYENIHHADLIEEHTTTPSPPPSPSTPKPVVGHFRVGFKLFYIPLYAGIVFVAFTLMLMINSISRHKGQVPYDFLTNPPARMLSDDVAERVIRALETSRQKYNTRHK